MSPDIRIAAPHCYTYRTESPLHSEFVGRPPATLEKRIPINLAHNVVRRLHATDAIFKILLKFQIAFVTTASAGSSTVDGTLCKSLLCSRSVDG